MTHPFAPSRQLNAFWNSHPFIWAWLIVPTVVPSPALSHSWNATLSQCILQHSEMTNSTLPFWQSALNVLNQSWSVDVSLLFKLCPRTEGPPHLSVFSECLLMFVCRHHIPRMWHEYVECSFASEKIIKWTNENAIQIFTIHLHKVPPCEREPLW